jgi:hypothetical protein
MSKKAAESFLNEEDEKDLLNTPSVVDEDYEVDTKVPLVNTPTRSNREVPVKDKRNKTEQIKDYRKKLVASLGLSELLIPPITRRRTAIYQLVNMKGKRDHRLMGPDEIPEPPPFEMVPTYLVDDPGENDLSRSQKPITYWEGTESKSMEDPLTKELRTVIVPKPGTPAFINGQKVINIMKQFNHYVWFENHPRNASNKRRDRGLTPLFERVDTKYESPHTLTINMNFMRDAEDFIVGLKANELVNIAAAMKNPTIPSGLPPETLRYELRARARKSREAAEEILFTRPDAKASIKLAVIHALDYGIISFLAEFGGYYFDDEKSEMFRVPVDSDPFDAVVNFLAEDDEGKECYKEIKKRLDFWF